MKYKLVIVQNPEPTQDELNSLSKKGYRLVSGPVIVKGGKSYLVMQKDSEKPVSESKKEKPVEKLVEKTSEDSSEVK